MNLTIITGFLVFSTLLFSVLILIFGSRTIDHDNITFGSFNYTVVVKIKRKKYMDAVVFGIVKDVLHKDTKDVFTILNEGGRSAHIMVDMSDVPSQVICDSIMRHELSVKHIIKSAYRYEDKDMDTEPQFLITVTV